MKPTATRCVPNCGLAREIGGFDPAIAGFPAMTAGGLGLDVTADGGLGLDADTDGGLALAVVPDGEPTVVAAPVDFRSGEYSEPAATAVVLGFLAGDSTSPLQHKNMPNIISFSGQR